MIIIISSTLTVYYIGGTDFTVKFAKGFYEPKYHITPYTSSSNELELEHRAWIEDQFANPPPVLISSKWNCIGVVVMNDNNINAINYYHRHNQQQQQQQLLSTKMTKSIIHHHHHSNNDNNNNMNLNTCVSNDDNNNNDITYNKNNNNNNDNNYNCIINNNNNVDIINFTDDIHLGYNYFFIDSINSKIWHVPDGTSIGQNIQIRKISCQDFNYDVNIYIKHQDLCSPNNKSCIYIMKINKYFISFSWSGKYWMLEYCQ